MTRYAVVDLEATDAHSSENKIIQIGIALVENGEIVGNYTTDVNPHEPLLPRIQELTGLSDARLKKAPDFAQVADEVHNLLRDCVFVAHNAKFDYGLMWKSFQQLGIEFELPRVDTVELARVFYPTFDKYGMEALGEKLKLNHDHPHAAMSDALATAELLLKIQEKARQLPRMVLGEIINHSENLLYETAYFLKEQIEFTKIKPAGFELIHNIATKKSHIMKVRKNKSTTLSTDFVENLAQIGLNAREKQIELAKYMDASLSYPQTDFIEAPTGMGKTFAYLLPLLASGKKIVVSTPTKILQNQLMRDVAPVLIKKFGVRMAKIVGNQNYISIEKFSNILENNTDGKNFEIFKMKVLVWLTETTSGELDELSKVMTNDDYLSVIAYSADLQPKQLHYMQEFWPKAQEKAKHAQIKVVNHAYLIERLADYPESFLENRVLVVDEAQQLFETMEKLGQKSIRITDELLKIDGTESQLKKRLQESLVYQLNKKNLDLAKIRLDAEELGLSELTDLLSDKHAIVWKENDRLFASNNDFYNFAQLVPESTKLYMIGATLSLSDKNPSFPELLGFREYHFYKILGEKAKNQELIAMTDGPNVKNTSIIDYAHYTAEAIAELAELGFPIVVLFTSKMSLTFTAEKLSADGWNILAQDINGTAAQIKKKFDRGESRILLGLGSFWEGVDFEKQKKLILVLPKLPFSTPDDILTKKYAQKFANPFYEFNVPMATLKLKQAFGRVNRKAKQKSIVVLLDNRILGKSYAKKMRRNISEIVTLKKLDFKDTVSEILEFLI
ncbi:helicase C-terminal domain-containing protein [Lactococcus fujiensis]|uniref:helicase C-terminal domain-containing protein n=1 Tax=Lactococcus fujiensis TaxID=610251 RepID=UPI000BDE64F2|nr:helicase C-terminal domain-containing protein [Lactococcus fujiensis]